MTERKKIHVIATMVSSNEKIARQCLDSLFEHNTGDACTLEVVLVWNAPGRGGAPLSPAFVADYSSVRMIESFRGGFEFNQNLMLEKVSADYLLIINDDLIFLPGSVSKAIAYMEAPGQEKVGMVGIKLLNRDGTLQPSTYSFPGLARTLLAITNVRSLIPLTASLFPIVQALGLGSGRSRYWEHDRTVDVDTFRGSYMLARGEACQQVGLMDVHGGQETEWIYRFHKRGWRVVFLHDAEIIHLGSVTVSQDKDKELTYLKIFLRFFALHRGRWQNSFLRASCVAFYALKYAGATLKGNKDGAGIARQAIQLARNRARTSAI